MVTSEDLAERINLLSYKAVQSIDTLSAAHLKDFSILPPPSQVFGYEAIVEEMLRKSLRTRIGCAGGDSSAQADLEVARLSQLLGVKPCRGAVP